MDFRSGIEFLLKRIKAFGYVIFINILSAKTNPILTFLTPWFLLDVLCTVPLILSIFFPIIRMVWIPSFLQIWLARNLLNEVVNYVQRNSKNTHSILFYKLLQLLMTFVALVISCIGKFPYTQSCESSVKISMAEEFFSGSPKTEITSTIFQ